MKSSTSTHAQRLWRKAFDSAVACGSKNALAAHSRYCRGGVLSLISPYLPVTCHLPPANGHSIKPTVTL
eukprot:1026797-Rhodomonas_salina.1